MLNLSETLTNAKKGLPAVRGQSSLKVLYQQSIAKAVASSVQVGTDEVFTWLACLDCW